MHGIPIELVALGAKPGYLEFIINAGLDRIPVFCAIDDDERAVQASFLLLEVTMQNVLTGDFVLFLQLKKNVDCIELRDEHGKLFQHYALESKQTSKKWRKPWETVLRKAETSLSPEKVPGLEKHIAR